MHSIEPALQLAWALLWFVEILSVGLVPESAAKCLLLWRSCVAPASSASCYRPVNVTELLSAVLADQPWTVLDYFKVDSLVHVLLAGVLYSARASL